jgi:hypothetical protein
MDERRENLKAAIEALEQQIKRLAVQANLYEHYQMESGLKDYVRRERAKKALAYLKNRLIN